MIDRNESQVAVDWEARYRELQKKHREQIAGWTHDARNMLSGIIGTLELLRYSRLTHDQNEDVQLALHSANEMNSLFEHVLIRAQIQAGEIKATTQTFAIQELIQSIALGHESRARLKGLTFEFSIQKDCPSGLIGDSFLIKRIVTNLVDNAIKYTKEGGVYIQVNYDNSEELCQITVRDTGIGIDPDDRTRIFRIFQQSEPLLRPQSAEGFGIGLFICWELTSLMNGNIQLESTLNKGSTFIVTLPLPNTRNG